MIGRQLGRYEILGRLGSGGMGEVYRARDRDLGREVAVKVLPEELAANSSRLARFEFEARTASALNHPNIVTIYEIGRAEGTAYIAMELIEGRTLRALLEGRPLISKQALGYAAQAADGLARAHAAGIVHRDLKPENIMITSDGRVKILDFGLAKVEAPLGEVDSQSPTGHATQPGALLGTVSYMSPEQARGRPVDYRSDQFSCGLILYEMATGRKAFQRASAVQTLSAIIEQQPEPIAAANPACPAPFRWIIERCLSKSPEDRYASTLDLARELQTVRDNLEETLAASTPSGRLRLPVAPRRPVPWRPAAGLAIAAAAAILLWPRLEGRLRPAGPAGEAPVVAVLPFENLGAAADEFLAVGVADVLATGLARASGVTLVAPSATRGYRGKPDLAQIGRELGASLIVEGTLQRLGERLHLSIRLVEAATRRVVWSDGIDVVPQDLLAAQLELADGVATALELRLSPEERSRLARPPTANPAALADYAQARSFLERPDVEGNVERAITLFEAAIGKDRRFALAHAGLGEAYWERYRATKDAAWTTRALESILEALRLDPEQPQVRIALATAYRGSGRNDEAVDELRRALALQPNNDDAHRLLGTLLADLGRTDEAIAELRRALALRPDYWRNHSFLGNAYFRLGRYDDAIASFQRLTELQPDNARGFQMLGTAYHAKGDAERALANYEKAIAIAPLGSAYSNIGTIHYAAGRYGQAARAYEKALELDPKAPAKHRNLGDVYRRLGREDDARRAYASACRITEQMLEVNPNDARTLGMLAVYEAKLGRFEKARPHAAQAVELAPADADVRYRQAVVLALASEPQAALGELREALARGFSASVAREDEDLESLRALPAFAATVAQAPQDKVVKQGGRE